MPVTGSAVESRMLPRDRVSRRLVQLVAGLLLYGFSLALLVRAGVGLDPWDVFHEGVTRHTPLSFGTVVIVTGALVLLAWIPLRQRPGLGTVANVVLLGVAADVSLWLLPEPEGLALRSVLAVVAIALNGLATAMYIGAGLGPGPRDGLMTGLSARTGLSLRLVRTAIEVTVLVAGFLLGGTIGFATVLYALAIGPLAQALLPPFRIAGASAAASGPVTGGGADGAAVSSR